MYRIIVDPTAQDQIAYLPAEALGHYAAIQDVIALTPWNGEPQNKGNAGGAVRRWILPLGEVVYLIVEDQREVHVLLVLHLG